MIPLTAVDAFCGAGGLSLGLADAGYKVLLGFDNDPVCIETAQFNQDYISHPVLQCDVRTMLDGGLLRKIDLKPGELGLLAGGPPCQGFSVQRTVGSDEDERNNRIHDFLDLIEETMPRYFLMENVVGLGGKRGKHLLEYFINQATSLNYTVHHKTLDAQDYGVPQRRRRLFVIGQHQSRIARAFAWPRPCPQQPPTVRETIAHLPAPPANGREHPSIPGHRADKLSSINQARLAVLQPGQGRNALPPHLRAECHNIDAAIIGHRDVYGRMAWDDVAPTITARFDSFTRGKFGHPSQVRTISLFEGQLLQTFPANYRFSGNKVQVARQIGNAVPPRLAMAIARALIRSHLG